MDEARNKVEEANKGIIRSCARDSPFDIERDIAWTLKYIQDAYPKVGVETCIAGLSLWCLGRPVQEELPRKIRQYAENPQLYGGQRTGDADADWVNAQREISRHMPIAYAIPHPKPF